MSEDLKKFLEDYENGKIIETRSNTHLVILTIITTIMVFLAIYLMISYYCF